jgi:hypothetical protein
MTDDLALLKRTLKARLPGRISDAVARYGDFAALIPNDGAKEFAAHHAACKAALSHIDLLVKLLRWAADEPGKDEAETLGEADLLARARAALGDDDADDEEDAP